MWVGFRSVLLAVALISSCTFDSKTVGEIGTDGQPRQNDAGNDPNFCQQACPAVGGTCDGDVCEIACAPGQAGCERPSCPSGLSCRIRCEGAQACSDGVDCAAGAACDIVCNGANACSGDITCGSGACDVECQGLASCPRVECADACRCDVTCASPGSCVNQMCPAREGLVCTGLMSCTSMVDPACDACDGPMPVTR